MEMTEAQNTEKMPAITDDNCQWTQDDDGVWQTSCVNAWVFASAGPVENKMKSCPFCGRGLEVKDEHKLG